MGQGWPSATSPIYLVNTLPAPKHSNLQRLLTASPPALPGAIKGSVSQGTVLVALQRSPDKNWIQVEGGLWVMLTHPDIGHLLECVDAPPPLATPPLPVPSPDAPPVRAVLDESPKKASLTKSFELKQTRKSCGANLKSLDGDGASRDALLDHLCIQELLEDFRLKFRLEGIPEQMYDTDQTSTDECTIWCQTGGQLGPVPSSKSKTPPGGQRSGRAEDVDPTPPDPTASAVSHRLRRIPRLVPKCWISSLDLTAGGLRQRVAQLGGLRCIVYEIEGADPSVLVVLAHGINVLGDDLFGLAHQ